MDLSLGERQNVRKIALQILADAGLNEENWFALCVAKPEAVQRVIDAWPKRCTSFSYDAAAILGLGEASSVPLPEPGPDEVIIHVGPWSLQELLTCDRVAQQNLLQIDEGYKQLPFRFFRRQLTPGIYRLRVPIPGSNNRQFLGQEVLLREGEGVAPVALVAAALLCHLMVEGKDLLYGDVVRCEERIVSEGPLQGSRPVLKVNDGRVQLSIDWDKFMQVRLWLASSVLVS